MGWTAYSAHTYDVLHAAPRPLPSRTAIDWDPYAANECSRGRGIQRPTGELEPLYVKLLRATMTKHTGKHVEEKKDESQASEDKLALTAQQLSNESCITTPCRFIKAD